MLNFGDYIINEKNMLSNIRQINRFVGKKTKICAIVKADAYGIGLEYATRVLSPYVDFFGVACVAEAKKIRKIDYLTNILVLSVVNPSQLDYCINNNISITVTSIEQLKYYQKNIKFGVLKIHLKVDTGLNRIGFKKLSEYKYALNFINVSDNLKLEGVFSHFATKGNDLNFMELQYQKFLKFTKYVLDSDVICHISNSFGTLYDKKYHMDMARIGFALYNEYNNNFINLKNVLSIKTQIAYIHRVKCGESVGYNKTFFANKDMIIGIVPFGYADGLDRKLSNNFYLLVNGIKCSIIGNICMDVAMIDITNVKNCFVGSEVVIVGKSGNEKLTLLDYATVLKTSTYEIMLRFNYKRLNFLVKND